MKKLKTNTSNLSLKRSDAWFRSGFFVAALLLCVVFSVPICAQTGADPGNRTTSESNAGEKAFQKWAFVPIVASSTETGFMFGALAVRFLEPGSPNAHTSTIDMLAFGSVKGQYSAIVSPNLYFADGKYHLDAHLRGAYWPGKYYGIGNDTPSDDPLDYESTSFEAGFLFERQIGTNSYVGGSYTFQHEEIDSDDDMLWVAGNIPGSEGGNQAGPGIALSFDTRDNINDARAGSYLLFESKWFRDTFGSDYDYTLYEFQASRYITLSRNAGLALAGQVRLARGDIPFRELSSPDGMDILRGIENGRYRDRDMAALQAEYRFPIKGRWGGTLFAESAQVAHDLGDIRFDDWKYSLGAGVRYALNPSERFNLRVDLSYVDNGFGFVLNIREAF
jgi:hypothetical protein